MLPHVPTAPLSPLSPPTQGPIAGPSPSAHARLWWSGHGAHGTKAGVRTPAGGLAGGERGSRG